jgi:primary-amine oxidase
VLNRASVAEIHVPYLKGQPRFLDLTLSTNGLGAHAQPLSGAECDGVRHPVVTFEGMAHICEENEDGGYTWKMGSDFRKGEAVKIFQVSQLGNYVYVNQWTFKNDGAIEVEMGLTGQLQIEDHGAAYLPFGARLNREQEPQPRVGADHQHNIYYRLDFDLDGPGNDLVSRRVFSPWTKPSPDDYPGVNSCATPGTCGSVSFVPIRSEVAQSFSLSAQNTWLVEDKNTRNADGRRIGYELIPHLTGNWRGRTSADEPWAGSDLWVTAHNRCELVAVNNEVSEVPEYGSPIPVNCPASTAKHLQSMVNGQSTDGANVVVWYANRFLHHTRDEDAERMPIEFTGFEIAPRNFHHEVPVGPRPNTGGPSFPAPRPVPLGDRP